MLLSRSVNVQRIGTAMLNEGLPTNILLPLYTLADFLHSQQVVTEPTECKSILRCIEIFPKNFADRIQYLMA